MLRRGVIKGNFFARLDRAQSVKLEPAMRDPTETVRRAGVIDNGSRAATAAGVDAPAAIEFADADSPPAR